MSKKIKTVYDADKSAGNDPSKKYLLPTQDEGNPDADIALDIDQIAAAVSTRIGVSPPPEPTENLAQLVLTLQENTLVPNVQAITGIDYTHYNVVTDSATVPTYPTGFINGPVPQLLPTLAGWAPETKYVYLYDLPTTSLKPLTDSDGTSGITLTPVDTLPRPAITDFSLSAGADDTTQALLTFTKKDDPTPGSGDGNIDLLNWADLSVVKANVTTGQTISGLTPGAEYKWLLRQYDLASPIANYSDSNAPSIIMEPAIGGTIEIDLSAAVEFDEASTPAVLTFKRTGDTTGACSATVSTQERTADAPTRYTELSAAALSFGAGASTATVNLTVNDTSSSLNQMLDLYIDAGSAVNCEIGAIDAALITLLGSGGAATDIIDMDLDTGVGYNNTAVWEFEDYNVMNIGTGAYAGDTYEELPRTGAGGPDKVMVAINGNRIVPATLDAANLEFEVEFGTGGGSISYPTTFYFAFRGICSANWYSNIYVAVDGAAVSAQEPTISDSATDQLFWSSYVPISIQSAGTHTINIMQFEPRNYGDRAFVTTDNSYDPTVVGGLGTAPAGSDQLGPPASGTTTGVATDDPNNPNEPLVPPPVGAITATSLVPANGATNQSPATNPSAQFNSTSITLDTFTLTFNAGADSVSGSSGISVNHDSVIFYPGTPLSNSVTYEAKTTGTATDASDGVVKSFDETWSFTIVPVPSGDILASQDFSSVSSVPFDVTKAWINANFTTNTTYFGTSYIDKDSNPSYDHAAITIVADPKGSSGRGNVMRVHQSANSIGYSDGDDPPSGGSWGFGTALSNISGTWTTLYFSYDYYRATINEFTGLPPRLPRIHKMPGLSGGKWGDGAGGSQPTGYDGFTCRGLGVSSYGNPSRVPLGNYQGITGYSYAADPNQIAGDAVTWKQKNLWPDDGLLGDPLYQDVYSIPLGEWFTIEQQITLNTSGLTGGIPHTDGIFKQWIKRPGDAVGQLVTSRSDVPWRVDANIKINGAWLIFGYGGSDLSYSVDENQYHYYDNFIISTSRITD